MVFVDYTIITEGGADGSTGADDIANISTALNSGKKIIRRLKVKKKTQTLQNFINEEIESTYDYEDVVSKLKSAERKSTNQVMDQETKTFGLEDEQGNLVKVWVPADQAEDFEEQLKGALEELDSDDDGDNSGVEIAEILYNLKGEFDILDVEYPTIPEDEENTEQSVEAGDAEAEGDEASTEGDPEAGTDDMAADGMDASADMAGGGEEQASSILQQVIDMMSADAEARKAEANAKKAEADADIATATANSAAAKISQEEQILDMEDYNNEQQAAEKEAKRLAKLAKYRHDMKKDDITQDIEGGMDSSYTDADNSATTGAIPEENEELASKVTRKQLSSILLKSLKSK